MCILYIAALNVEGCIKFDSHVGLNGFASANVDWSLCSDGFHFNFVPLQSALDYGDLRRQDLERLDIENENINTKLALMPARADVMIGYPGRGNYSNRPHVNFRNDEIRNINNSSEIYFSCMPTGERVLRRMLNLEIGDEELYLENNRLLWTSDYRAEYDLHVNDRNPNYEYVAAPGRLDGIYSRDEDFVIDATGFANFFFDQTNSPTGIGFNFTNPSGTWALVDQPQDNCCRNLLGRRNGTPPVAIWKKKPLENTLMLYPNPNNGRQAIVRYRFKHSGTVRVELISMTGQTLLQKTLNRHDATVETSTVLDLSHLSLPAGIYLVRVTNGRTFLTTRMLVGKN